MIVKDYISLMQGVLIGNENFNVLIPNRQENEDDEELKIYIINEEEFLSLGEFINLRFETFVEGKFNIYKYDLFPEGEVLAEIEGRYSVFSNGGDVYFEKIEQ